MRCAAVGDLDVPEPSVPLGMALDDRPQRFADAIDGRSVVDRDGDDPGDGGGVPRPVLKRMAQEVGQWDHQSTVVPDAYDDVGRTDLLDATPLSLDDEHVVEVDRLGQRDLDRRQDGLDERARGEADDQTCNARRGEKPGTDHTNRGERGQHRTGRHDHDQHDQNPREHPKLRVDRTSLAVVFHLHLIATLDYPAPHQRDGNDEPAHRDDHGDGRAVANRFDNGLLKARGRYRSQDCRRGKPQV